MSIKNSYSQWAQQYDTNQNKTRDLEAVSLRRTLSGLQFKRILEIGCGTGKNSEWLRGISEQLIAIDLSEEMLAIARDKVPAGNVSFQQADITGDWDFASGSFDLISFSLVLEHIQDLVPVFQKTAEVLKAGRMVYVSELHPFKQYGGTKARFETEEGTHIVECYNHHLSDFCTAGTQAGLTIERIEEYFDDDDRSTIPRILTLVFRKP